MIPSLAAMAIILPLFLFSFQDRRSVLFALGALVVGIVYDIGVIGATIGELNLMSSSFAVILIGLGIDFGIHMVSSFNDFRSEGHFAEGALKETLRRTGPTIVIGAVTILLAIQIPGYRVIHDTGALGPQDAPATNTQRRIQDHVGMSPCPSMALAGSLEEARELTEALENHPLVAEVSSAARLVLSPAEEVRRLEAVRRIRDLGVRGRDAKDSSAEVEALAGEIQRLEWNVIEIGDLSVTGLGEDNRVVRLRNRLIREIFGAEVRKPVQEEFQRSIGRLEEDPAVAVRTLQPFDHSFAQAMDRMVTRMFGAARPVGIEDLPADLRRNLISPDGTGYLVTLFPTETAAGEEGMIRFADETAAIEAGLTGVIPLLLQFTREVARESVRASLRRTATRKP